MLVAPGPYLSERVSKEQKEQGSHQEKKFLSSFCLTSTKSDDC